MKVSDKWDWITPAWAGKSEVAAYWDAVDQDHPRVGGEKVYLFWKRHCITGSPPRGRGKVNQFLSDFVVSGITPAWAGKRVRQRWGRIINLDHPRVGGEKSTTA